jgi:hypothetical protein
VGARGRKRVSAAWLPALALKPPLALARAPPAHPPQAVSAEFRGGAASRLLRGSLVASLPGLSFQHSSAETMGSAARPPGADGAATAGPGGHAAPDTRLSGGNTVGELSERQQHVIGNLQRIRAVVKHHVAQVRAGLVEWSVLAACASTLLPCCLYTAPPPAVLCGAACAAARLMSRARASSCLPPPRATPTA